MNILCKMILCGLVANIASIEALGTRNRSNQASRKVIVIEEEKPPVLPEQSKVDFKVSATEALSVGAEKEKAQDSIVLKPMDIVAHVKGMADRLKLHIKKLVKDKVDADDMYALKEKIVEIISSMSHVITEHKDILKEEAHVKTVNMTLKNIFNVYLEWAEAIGHGKTLSPEVFPEFYAIDQTFQDLQRLAQNL